MQEPSTSVWQEHLKGVAAMMSDVTRDSLRAERLALFWWFVCERQTIWQRRVMLRQPPPWTHDPVLQSERFTNVYRELDPGTQYAIHDILERDVPKPDKVFNIMLYRLIGRAETHAALGFQQLDDFDPIRMEQTLKRLRCEGKPPFTAAYMVSAYRSMGSTDKIENVTRLLTRLHRRFDEFYARIAASHSPAEVHRVLSSAYGFGNFLAYQVLVDLLYPLRISGNVGLLPYSHDDWASAGPGARRGIALLLQEGIRAEYLDVMRWLRANQDAEFSRLGLDFPYLRDEQQRPIPISLANIQNCLCEFHKYVKIRDGTGRGRRRFTSSADPTREIPIDAAFHYECCHTRSLTLRREHPRGATIAGDLGEWETGVPFEAPSRAPRVPD